MSAAPMPPAERAAWAKKSNESALNSASIATVFGPDHAKLMRLKTHPKQCALGLFDPLGGDMFGHASYFVRMWESLLDRDQTKFRTYVGGPRVLALDPPLDFCVHVDKHSTGPVVVFYVRSRLQLLSQECFRNVTDAPAIDQALRILHHPDTEYAAFLRRASDQPEAYLNDAGIAACLGKLMHLSLA